MDAKLAGGHWQCDWDDGTCSEMESEIEFAEKDPAEKSNQFKYIFDVSHPFVRMRKVELILD
jgi:beta-1,2-xylosyltransferase